MSYQFIINRWNGGMTNDEYAGQAGSFLNGEGVEIRKKSRSFSISRNGGTEVTPSGGGYPVAFVGESEAGMLSIMGNGTINSLFNDTTLHIAGGGYAYRNYVSSFATVVSGTTYLNVIVGRETTAISAFNYTVTPTVSVVDGIISLGALKNVTDYRPLLVFNGNLLIGDGNYVSMMDSNRVVTNVLPLGANDTVMGMTIIGDQILIFCKNGVNGIVYYWNGVSLTPQRRVFWIDNPISNIANVGNQVYVWNANGIYLSDGYQRSMQYKSYQNEAGINPYLFLDGDNTNAIETLDRVIYFPGHTNGLNTSSKGAILSMGVYQPGTPQSLVKEFTFGSSAGDVCSAMYWLPSNHSAGGTTPAKLFYGVKGTSTNKVGVKKEVGTTGFIETSPMVGDASNGLLECHQKSAKKIQIGYKMPFTSTGGTETTPSIVIYAKTDDGAYTLVKTITDRNKRGDWFTYTSPFYKIQFKIELNAGVNSNGVVFSPEFFDFTLFYDPNNIEG